MAGLLPYSFEQLLAVLSRNCPVFKNLVLQKIANPIAQVTKLAAAPNQCPIVTNLC